MFKFLGLVVRAVAVEKVVMFSFGEYVFWGALFVEGVIIAGMILAGVVHKALFPQVVT